MDTYDALIAYVALLAGLSALVLLCGALVLIGQFIAHKFQIARLKELLPPPNVRSARYRAWRVPE